MPRAIKKRAKKKANSEPDVQEKLLDMKTAFEQKQKKVALYGVALLVVVLIVGGFFVHKYRSDQKANQLEYEGYKVFYNEYSSQPLPDKEKYQKALDLFQQSYQIRETPRALLYIADSYYKLGNNKEALKTLDDFAAKYPDNSDLLPLAYKEMANIQLWQGDRAGALKALDKLYNTPGGIFRDYALIQSGRILEGEGKKKEAMDKYREIVDQFKSSPFYAEASAKLAEATKPKEGAKSKKEAKPGKEAKPEAKKRKK